MKISMIVEGKTEKAFVPALREFLKPRLSGKMPKLDVTPYDGRIPNRENDLLTAINQCAELRAFVNTILSVSGGQVIP